MSTRVAATRDDRVLPYTRVLRLFASLLGVARIVHWNKFNHAHIAFWLWAGLYFTAPFLVFGGWLANWRCAAPARIDEPRLGRVARWTVGPIGMLALVQGIVMFLAPAQVIAIWPWTLTPLTCRVVGAIFCLGSTGIGVLVDPRWSTVRLMLQVEALMVSLNVCRQVSEDVPGVGGRWDVCRHVSVPGVAGVGEAGS